MPHNKLRERLKLGKAAYGLWVGFESPAVTEIAAALGLHWVCVDMEHGHLDFKDAIEHLRAANGSDTTVLIRVPELSQSMIKRALDIGAEGIIIPLIQNAQDAQTAVRYGRYPPAGVRSVGGERAVRWGIDTAEYLGRANEDTMVIPLIETTGAVQDIDAILAVSGIEAIFFGPADLSATHGFLGQWEGPGMAETILAIKDKATRLGIASGILARRVEDSVQRRDQGFAMIGLGSDSSLLIRSIRENLERLSHPVAAER
jgi:2-keto-3-deoxy-L-rhamnonate aldolase RhmA